MNPIYQAASNQVVLGGLMGAMTVLFFACYIGWALWAYLPSRRAAMEAASRIPFEEDEA